MKVHKMVLIKAYFDFKISPKFLVPKFHQEVRMLRIFTFRVFLVSLLISNVTTICSFNNEGKTIGYDFNNYGPCIYYVSKLGAWR